MLKQLCLLEIHWLVLYTIECDIFIEDFAAILKRDFDIAFHSFSAFSFAIKVMQLV